ncbi:hypothetical protein BMS3Bbin14_00618 [bacterium BMS3Bbin14]|nr:hypothetical protein BMS3Bbin14_00613 [bacterium BMS3Bbin14]HDH16308.1 hypothetical protein [Gammaproteobacteria bacterium]HDN94532.1 hypothetical protein [Nitrospirota bacterium]GBE52159.1 hypothetical protein BMS3Bbin14_00618 [bacterium BMS3Bbin14]HDO66852.1 hypothetical protein [Nitrospirota bacterium]
MGFEVIHEEKPSYSGGAMAAIVLLSIILLGIGVVFAYLLISGKGNDYIMGTLLSLEFLIAGVDVVLYARYFIGFREVSEDREEELLW